MVSSTIVYSQIQSNQTKDCCLHFQIDWSLTNNFYFLGKALPLTYSVPCTLTNILSLLTYYLGHFLLQETRKDQQNYKSKRLMIAQSNGENNAYYLDPKTEERKGKAERGAERFLGCAGKKASHNFFTRTTNRNVESFRAKWNGCMHRIITKLVIF